MNLRDLRYLCAVAEYEHFGRAAEACHVSQPTLSMQLQKLEQTLGVQLFERSNRFVQLTEAGLNLLPRAQEIIVAADDMVVYAQQLSNPLAGTLTLGVIPTICPYLLPLITRPLRDAFPQLSIVWQELQSADCLLALQQMKIDGALLALPYEIGGLHAQILYAEPFALLLPPAERQAHAEPITMAAVSERPVLLLEKGHCLRDQAMALCQRQTWQEQLYRATSLETLRELVASGLGCTLLPQLAVDVDDHCQPVVDASREVALVSRAASARQTALQPVGQVIAASAKSALR